MRPLRDFLMAIHSKEPQFASMHLMNLGSKTEEDFHSLIEDFRQYVRLFQASASSSKGTTHSAFATATEEQGDPTFNGQKAGRKCVCESTGHSTGYCFYLVKDRRPRNWKPRANIQAIIDEAMKDQKTRTDVKQAIKEAKDRKKRKDRKDQKDDEQKPKNDEQNSKTDEAKRKDTEAFTTIRTASSFSADSYSIRGSWILDNGSNSHVCNSTMRSRFERQRDGSGDYLTAGTQRLPIECYGTVRITVATPTGPQNMTLLNVAYVGKFMTNLVSQHLLDVKGLHFDSWKRHLHREGATVATVKLYNGHYLLEDNVTGTDAHLAIASFPTSNSSSQKVATSFEWHQMLGHASSEVIQHLEASAEGVKVSDDVAVGVPRTNECEPCALSKTHRVVSRSHENAETSIQPFYRVTYDLMQLSPAMNKDEWVSHFACHATDFNMVFTHQRKSEATKIVREAINVIKTRFNATVVFLRSDGERSLGNEFNDLLVETGITHEPSASDSPEQNGHSERKGGILAMKARAIRIDAGLPTFLWPELIRTAGYLANRTPMKKHD